MTRLMAISGGFDDGRNDARGARSASSSRWLVLLALLVPALVALGAWLIAGTSSNESLGPVRGLRLGLAPAQARAALATDRPGSFSSVAMDEDFALVWTPDGPAGELRLARLEFHLGQLVAVRMTLAPSAPEAAGPELEVSEASILTREPTSEGVELTWIARSCPTHAAEVRQRLERS